MWKFANFWLGKECWIKSTGLSLATNMGPVLFPDSLTSRKQNRFHQRLGWKTGRDCSCLSSTAQWIFCTWILMSKSSNATMSTHNTHFPLFPQEMNSKDHTSGMAQLGKGCFRNRTRAPIVSKPRDGVTLPHQSIASIWRQKGIPLEPREIVVWGSEGNCRLQMPSSPLVCLLL